MEFTDNSTNNVAIIESLIDSRWINDLTRAVFLEFTLYNSNSHMFSVVIMVVEFTPMGRLYSKYDITTLDMIRYWQSIEWSFVTTQFIYVAIMIVFIFRVLRNAYLHRLAYFTYFRECFELSVVILSITSMVLFIRKTVVISRLLDYELMGKNGSISQLHGKGDVGTLLNKGGIPELIYSTDSAFINFYEVAVWDTTLRYLLAIQVFLITLKIVEFMSFTKLLGKYFYTIKTALPVMFNYLIIVFFSFVLFTHVGILMFGTQIDEFKNVPSALFTIVNMLVRIGDFQTIIYATGSIHGPLFFGLFTFFALIYVLSIFRSVLMQGYTAMLTLWTVKPFKLDVIEYVRREMGGTANLKVVKEIVEHMSAMRHMRRATIHEKIEEEWS